MGLTLYDMKTIVAFAYIDLAKDFACAFSDRVS